MYLNFYNLENSEGDKIDFSIDKEALYLIIFMNQKKDDYTQFKTLFMKIQTLSSRRVRSLQT